MLLCLVEIFCCFNDCCRNLFVVEEVRNDLYIVLDYGDFQQGSKTAPKNVEATLEVISENGEVLKVSMKTPILCQLV